MTYNNETYISTDWLVYKADLDGWVPSGSTATNVTWVSADRGYVEEVGSFNWTNSYIQKNTAATTWTTATFSFWLYKTNNNDQAYFCELNYADAAHCFYDAASDKINYRFGWTNILSTSASPVLNNTWNLITVEHSWTTATIEINWVIAVTWTVNSKTSSWTWLILGKLWQLNIYYLNWKMGLFKIYNKLLDNSEKKSLLLEGLRRLWPTNAPLSWDFPKYSLPNLEEGKVLEISRSQASWTYYDQTGNGNNWTPTNITDSTNGLYNVMNFNGNSSNVVAPTPISSMTQMSIWVTFNLNSTTGTHYICSSRHSWQDDIRFVFDNWTLFVVWDDWTATFVSCPLSDTKKHRLVGVNDWTKVVMYFDWTKIWETTWVYNFATHSNNNITIWQRDSLISSSGHLDWEEISFNVWNKALSETEIQQDYYSSKLI